MKKKFIPLILALSLAAAGCKNSGKAEDSGEKLDKDTSYAFGMLMAGQYNLPGVNLDYDAFVEGYKAQVAENTRLTEEDAIKLVQPVLMAAMQNQALGFQEEETKFLEENRQKPGVTVTSSGLQYEVISQGSGKKPAPDDMVRVNYRGTLVDGTVFDSSYERGQPVEFPLGGVIPGWTEGLQLMNEGGNYRFYIPSSLGYGPEGVTNVIPPYALLIFEVELLEILGE